MLKWSAFPLKHATGNTMSEFIAENRGADAITRPNWSAVFSVAFCVACLIIVEFLPVSLLTPMAQDLGISEGVAGQSVTVTAFVAMFASLFITQTIQSSGSPLPRHRSAAYCLPPLPFRVCDQTPGAALRNRQARNYREYCCLRQAVVYKEG